MSATTEISLLLLDPEQGPQRHLVPPDEDGFVRLESLQFAVGGYVEALGLSLMGGKRATLWLNEDGHALGLRENTWATEVARVFRPGGLAHPIVGRAVITGVDGDRDTACPEWMFEVQP